MAAGFGYAACYTLGLVVHLLPWLLLMYMLAYLDRANLGFAKNAFQASTGISEAAYAFGVGIFSIAYSSIEVPSNILMHRFGARRWLSRIMVSWGLVSACMAFVHSATAFYGVRVLLGIAEAGFFPLDALPDGTTPALRVDNNGSLASPHLHDYARAMVRDLGSTNGTLLNGRKITESPLPPDSTITIGRTDMIFRVVAQASAPARPAASDATRAFDVFDGGGRA